MGARGEHGSGISEKGVSKVVKEGRRGRKEVRGEEKRETERRRDVGARPRRVPSATAYGPIFANSAIA